MKLQKYHDYAKEYEEFYKKISYPYSSGSRWSFDRATGYNKRMFLVASALSLLGSYIAKDPNNSELLFLFGLISVFFAVIPRFIFNFIVKKKTVKKSKKIAKRLYEKYGLSNSGINYLDADLYEHHLNRPVLLTNGSENFLGIVTLAPDTQDEPVFYSLEDFSYSFGNIEKSVDSENREYSPLVKEESDLVYIPKSSVNHYL